MRLSRRELLGASAVGLAGCLGRGNQGDDNPTSVYASFFTLADWTRQIAGENVDVQNAVPAGEHGHAWEPPTSLLPQIVETDAFVYFDVDGFQPWAEDAAETIANDYDDVELIDATSGIDLREYSGHGHDHDHDHSHGAYDAKFFSDPLRAADGIENVRSGLSRVDPSSASEFVDNADGYIDRLKELHESFEERLADRTHDAVVLAGHDSFGYLADRYGFEIHTPVGLSPADSPSSDRIADAVSFISEEGIEHVLWDYFDGDRLAETIADNADHDVETVMTSPAESTTEQWLSDGYGDYIGQMTEINLPAFARALGA